MRTSVLKGKFFTNLDSGTAVVKMHSRTKKCLSFWNKGLVVWKMICLVVLTAYFPATFNAAIYRKILANVIVIAIVISPILFWILNWIFGAQTFFRLSQAPQFFRGKYLLPRAKLFWKLIQQGGVYKVQEGSRYKVQKGSLYKVHWSKISRFFSTRVPL